jgi:uncharacterized coiled-coil protein SlyX
MNPFLKKAGEIFSFSKERLEKLTAEEQTKLEAYGETASKLEQERDDATQAKADAEAQVVSLSEAVAEKDAKITTLESAAQEQEATIATLNDSITEKDAKIQELEEKIASLPGAEDTAVNTGEETIPTTVKEDETPKYWTSADAELAAFQAKFRKQTTK